MTLKKNVNSDEINLLDILYLISEYKLLISFFLFIAIIISNVQIQNNKNSQSIIDILFNNSHPFHKNEKILNDFKEIFYSKNNFKSWKKDNINSEITYETITYQIENENNFLILKEENETIVSFEKFEKKNYSIVVKSNQKKIILDLFSYINHTNKYLHSIYVLEAKKYNVDLINFTQNHYNGFDLLDVFNLANKLKNFINNEKNETHILKFTLPTSPVIVNKVAPIKLFIIYIISCFIISIILAIIHNKFLKKQK